jgi:hypothetical protein
MFTINDNDDMNRVDSLDQVKFFEDIICLEYGIVPISVWTRLEGEDPFAGIDPDTARKMKRKYRKLLRQFGKNLKNPSWRAPHLRWKIRSMAWEMAS